MAAATMASLWGCCAAAALLSLAALFLCAWRAAANPGRPANGRRLLGLGLTILTALLALASPLHPLSDRLFSAHMVEHELFLNTIPLALLTSEPATLAVIALRKLPARCRRLFGREAIRYSALVYIVASLGLPIPALLLSGLVLWAWHVPPVYDYALRNQWVHALEHASFLATAFLYWRPLLVRPRRGAMLDSNAKRTLYLMTGSMQTGILGALIGLHNSIIYTGYLRLPPTSAAFLLSDQRLGGYIMWFSGPLFCAAFTASVMR